MAILKNLLYALVSASVCNAVMFKPQNEFPSLTGTNPPIPVDLQALFNNHAFELDPIESGFSGSESE
ncbi:hypothetical protein N7495_002027 [Penicillium taxi]|uniref:uncharacterized protein n=1 Tax=Penicillium taxi TaxID=168475 RepID=UPI002545400E|nr:uncharacterized protein N7495_002027 [Penicillium taxi]KAJ5901499.1 hypothetical protein N7495_002027 [Penicillium taxi]